MLRFAVATAVALVFVHFASPSWSAPSFTGALGGPDGRHFDIRCPQGAYLTMMRGRAGAWIDRVIPTCGFPGTLQSDGARYFVNQVELAGIGGSGGTTEGGGCQRSDVLQNKLVITRLLVEVAHAGENTYVSNYWMDCRRLDPPYQDEGTGSVPPRLSRNAPGVQYEGAGAVQCPEGQWAIGIHGRAGIYIDSIGLVCDNPPGLSVNVKVSLPPVKLGDPGFSAEEKILLTPAK
jgi:hypothetical protein